MPSRLPRRGPGEAAARHALVGPSHLWQMKRDFQIGFLRSHGLHPSDHLLDLGCGTLRGGIPLIAYLDTGHYTGVDVRPEVIEEARSEAVEAGLTERAPLLLEVADLGSVDLGRRFDVVWAFQVFIHMSDPVLAAAAGFVARHLDREGRAFVSVRVGRRREGSWQGFPAITRPVSDYRDAFAGAGLTAGDLGPLASFGHVVPGQSEQQQASRRMLLVTAEA